MRDKDTDELENGCHLWCILLSLLFRSLYFSYRFCDNPRCCYVIIKRKEVVVSRFYNSTFKCSPQTQAWLCLYISLARLIMWIATCYHCTWLPLWLLFLLLCSLHLYRYVSSVSVPLCASTEDSFFLPFPPFFVFFPLVSCPRWPSLAIHAHSTLRSATKQTTLTGECTLAYVCVQAGLFSHVHILSLMPKASIMMTKGIYISVQQQAGGALCSSRLPSTVLLHPPDTLPRLLVRPLFGA